MSSMERVSDDRVGSDYATARRQLFHQSFNRVKEGSLDDEDFKIMSARIG